MIPTWIQQGDRSHPRLAQLDSLTFTYPGWRLDFGAAENSIQRSGYAFDLALHKLKEKQRVHEGDRSHPRLMALDELSLTYDGWQDDVREIEDFHFRYTRAWDSVFYEKLEALANKERLSRGDRSHPNLVALDALELTYEGFQEDLAAAESAHKRSRHAFERALHKLKAKQDLLVGDRTHPRLVALDKLELDYDGWQADVAEAEEYHVEYDKAWDDPYYRKLDAMKNKQQLSSGDRTHPDLVRLDALELTYSGWEGDYQAALAAHQTSSYAFGRAYHKLVENQRLFVGDRSNPRVVALDELSLTYPGFEDDLEDALRFHLDYPAAWNESFYRKIETMKDKERIFRGYRPNSDNDQQEPHAQSSASTPRNSTISTNERGGEEPQLSSCVICLVNPKSVAFVPCGHLCSCSSCASLTMQRNQSCPICRGSATGTLRVFIS